MAAFPLKVLSMDGVAFEGEVDALLVPTEKGPLLIESGYTNLITSLLSAGVMKIVQNGKSDYYAVFGGVVDVRKGGATTVYSEEINRGYDIDLARAIAARDRNLDRINSPTDDIDIKKARAHLMKALTRIAVKNLSEGGY